MANKRKTSIHVGVTNPPSLAIGITFTFLFALCVILLSSCNGATAPNPPPPAVIGVSVSPTSASVLLGGTQQFLATVTNTTNLSVTWNVNGILGGNSTVGTVSSTGLYTTPQILPQPASVTVQAISQADSTATASAIVTIAVPTAVTVTIAPLAASVLLGAAQQFTAAVNNTNNKSVNWNVNGVAGGNSILGTVSSSGLYTAPQVLPQPASVTVQAASQADPSATASAIVTITSPSAVTVTIAPLAASVLLGATQQFAATVGNTNNKSVNWNVNGIVGGNSQVGTVSPSGLFTAPQILPQPPNVTVQAVSQADSSAIGTAAVTITSDIALSVTPTSASVELGAAQTFIPHILSAGNPNSSVTWTVTGTSCAGTACGTIDASGIYLAPGVLPPSASVAVTARSVADTSKTATVPVTITSRFTLSISGPASVNAGATANYTAILTPAPNSSPNSGISWTVAGSGCTGAACGTISGSGASAVYQAPATAPFPSVITLTATPAADPTKVASMNVTINAQVSVVVTPGSASVALSSTQQFTAQVTGTVNTNVTWDVNGVVGGNTTLGTVTNISGANTTTYTAPSVLPSPPTVVVHAVSSVNPNAAGPATVTLTSSASLTLTPSSITSAVSHRQPFTAAVSGTPNTNVIWQVGGIPGGNTIVGQICVVASSPCQVVSTAPAGTVEYLAPAAIPSPNPVTLTATSQANPTQFMNSQITILSHIVVSVSPPSANLDPATTQAFTASVLGTTDQTVTWNVTGTACSGAGLPCGVINASGLYTAPISTPSPNAINIVATSSEDSSRTGSSSVTITNAMVITGLLPASAFAGGAGSFTLQVQGGNFLPTSPGPGSTILVGGTARTTLCSSSGICTTALTSTDLAAAGNLSVAMRNPNLTQSNTLNFVVVAAPPAIDVVPLTPTNSSATGKDIIVVEPSTAGSLAPQQNVTIAVAAMGIFSPAANTCTLGAGALVITRPASGTAIMDVCVFSVSGLDPSFTYSLTGPGTADITIIGKQPLGLGIVDLTLAIPASAIPGLRSLFVQNPNQDKAVATGALEVQ